MIATNKCTGPLIYCNSLYISIIIPKLKAVHTIENGDNLKQKLQAGNS